MSFIASTKSRLAIFAIAAAILAGASVHAAHAAHAADAAPTGVWMVTTYKVYDYNRWKPVHDRTASVKRSSFGWQKSTVFAVDGNPNHIMIMEQFGSLDRARAFAGSTELRDEMAASGVSTQPEVRFVNTLGETQ